MYPCAQSKWTEPLKKSQKTLNNGLSAVHDKTTINNGDTAEANLKQVTTDELEKEFYTMVVDLSALSIDQFLAALNKEKKILSCA